MVTLTLLKGKATRGKKRMELLHDTMEGGVWTVKKFNLGRKDENACQKPAMNNRRLKKRRFLIANSNSENPSIHNTTQSQQTSFFCLTLTLAIIYRT